MFDNLLCALLISDEDLSMQKGFSSIKFSALGSYLNKSTDDLIELTFQEIESIIGERLCNSAYMYPPYWQPSRTHTLPNTIIASGYNIKSVDLTARIVRLNKS